MPLLLLDLDNTLIDRAGAFRRWATGFVADAGGTDDDLAWLLDVDGDGFVPRETVAAAIRDRFSLTTHAVEQVVATLRDGVVAYLEPDPAVAAALDRAVSRGWTPFVVTNGATAQQERKLRHTGLDRHVAGWVVSQEAGVRKPDPGIFAVAAQRAGQSLDGAWMIGDAAHADIDGAHACGLPSVWLHRSRAWPSGHRPPTVIAASLGEAVDAVLAS